MKPALISKHKRDIPTRTSSESTSLTNKATTLDLGCSIVIASRVGVLGDKLTCLYFRNCMSKSLVILPKTPMLAREAKLTKPMACVAQWPFPNPTFERGGVSAYI